MTKVPYRKPALTYAEQIEQLQERGLVINNIPRATHLLESISYYRLSGYWYPLLSNKNNHTFKEDSKFQSAFQLYSFDRELRVLILRELEKIEVTIRAKLIYLLSHEYGPFWYEDSNLFSNHIKHSTSLGNLQREYERSDEEFIYAFREKYSNPLPPSWMMLEITSFGSLSFLYSNLKSSRVKRDIAKHFGMNDKTFSSWIHSIVYLRNVCAHHSRLWNRVMRIQPIKPRNIYKTWLVNDKVSNNRSYYILSIILFLMQTINPEHSIVSRFKSLLVKYPNVDVFAMGFPNNWEEEPLWQS
ncbi:MAG: Abi family protein [Maribacter litoralis]|uniref:Abi family protein n=1 Tax=Maribacter litoralis TaxID=2059726 RepID=UPI00329A54F7